MKNERGIEKKERKIKTTKQKKKKIMMKMDREKRKQVKDEYIVILRLKRVSEKLCLLINKRKVLTGINQELVR